MRAKLSNMRTGMSRQNRADLNRPATSDNAPYVVLQVANSRVSGSFASPTADRCRRSAASSLGTHLPQPFVGISVSQASGPATNCRCPGARFIAARAQIHCCQCPKIGPQNHRHRRAHFGPGRLPLEAVPYRLLLGLLRSPLPARNGLERRLAGGSVGAPILTPDLARCGL